MNVGFKKHFFKNLAEIEDGNFWFRARNQLILWALGKYAPGMRSFLEIGCGTGFVLSGISKRFPDVRLMGGEHFEEGLVYARQRVPAAEFIQMDALSIPYRSEWDAVGVFDVLEHIEADEAVLQQIYKALKPGGVVLITVPQHPWLWSAVDEYDCHERRYSYKELREKVLAAGFRILRTTSFVSILFPAMVVSRMAHGRTSVKDTLVGVGRRIPPWLNYLFEKILNFEMVMIRLGVNFPLGGSRFMVVRKT